jgi:hypothetical protein
MLAAETQDRIAQDHARWKANIEAARKRVAEAVEGLSSADARMILNSMMFYGWERPNRERHEPVWNR